MATRRSILGMIAGAPVAASAIGNQAVGQVASAEKNMMRVGGLASAGPLAHGHWLSAQIAEIRKDLANIGQDRDEHIARIRQHISQVDPDIASMRSLSDVTKQRMQAERQYDREIASRKSWLGRQLNELLSQSPEP